MASSSNDFSLSNPHPRGARSRSPRGKGHQEVAGGHVSRKHESPGDCSEDWVVVLDQNEIPRPLLNIIDELELRQDSNPRTDDPYYVESMIQDAMVTYMTGDKKPDELDAITEWMRKRQSRFEEERRWDDSDDDLDAKTLILGETEDPSPA